MWTAWLSSLISLLGGMIQVKRRREHGACSVVTSDAASELLLEHQVLLLDAVNLLLENGILFLEEAGSHRDLVLLHAPSVSRSFRRHVVLPAPRPVFRILLLDRNKLQTRTKEQKSWIRSVTRAQIYYQKNPLFIMLSTSDRLCKSCTMAS